MNEPIQNKYYKWYLSFCLLKREERGYYSRNYKPKHLISHHIIPKSFYKSYNKKNGWLEGNPHEKINLVFLTDKEHFIVHKLLTKFYKGLALVKCVYAYKKMSSKDGNFSRFYANARKIFGEIVIGINHHNYGKKENFLTKEKRSKALKGIPKSQEFKDNLKGKKQSKETIEKRLNKIIGLKRTKAQCQNISNSTGKIGIFLSPNNEIVNVKNISKFAEENNLLFGNLCMVLRGERIHHKGWSKYIEN